MSGGHPNISADRIFFLEKQQVAIEDFDSSELLLALGGGGEGIIGRLKGSRVVAIDTDRRELEEAPVGPLKIVMDARELKFLDGSFQIVTSFFTLMYIGKTDHPRIFQEAHRVLASGGRFLTWGASLPERPDDGKDVLIVPVTVTLPSTEVETGYGVLWPEEPIDPAHYVELAGQVGFEVVQQREDGHVFYLSLRKGAGR
jgi:SAM-dependent methyltransferase